MLNSTELIVIDSIKEILSEHNDENSNIEIFSSSKIINDLGFSSLMFAQLIIFIQDRVDRDPFYGEDSKFSISDVITVGDLIHAYSE